MEGMVIHWELCKNLKFDHTAKLCVHKPESIRKKETHKILWDFETQTDHLILTIRPDEEEKTAVMKWLKKKSTEFCNAEIHAFIWMWNNAIERNGDYVEK